MRQAFLIAAIAALPSALAFGAPPSASGDGERFRQLSEKLDAGTLSPEETQEFLRAISHMVRSPETPPAPRFPQPVAKGLGDKVIAVYHDRNTTKIVIEARQPLVAGIPVFVGPRETEVVLQDLLSRSKNLYYYAASAPGRVPADEGDAVLTQKTRVLVTPSPLKLKIKEVYTFEQKARGEVTAVQDGRAMIDRGTLHEVRERDIYKVLDSSGQRKGFLEIRGIGDLQSSGVLYDRLEDRRKRALMTEPGDRVVFLGQRKLFGFGGFYGASTAGRTEFRTAEKAGAKGLVWNLMFKDGWGVEAVLGSFDKKLKGSEDIRITRPVFPTLGEFIQGVDESVTYLFPVAVKKNFFFPSVASPFALVGMAFCDAALTKTEAVWDSPQRYSIEFNDRYKNFIPMLGAGVEFFPARLIRPRIDIRWFKGPTLRASDKTLRTEQAFASIGISSAW
ncbi:MAG: hypothetical protein HY928_06465 [Elusimicrobia bacterium]|nr:hypothetical protein [Elusimicrobiota bacterium]